MRAPTTLRQPDARAAQLPHQVLRLGVAVLALAAAFVNLWQDWYADPYFAAGVQSMRGSWHNFLYVSFDPAGFISVDKPPLALWLQTAITAVLGFHSLSLLLPAALAGLGSVAIVYMLVRRDFGETAALFAALCQTITPVAVACNRSNNMDSLVMFGSLLAAWAVMEAVDSGRLAPLLLGAAAVAAAFNTKLLQAYVVVPTFAFFYFVTSTLPPRGRIARAVPAALLLLGLSFAWVVIVDSTPASQRPYAGSSSNNTVTDLVFGYNGLGRITGGSTVAGAIAGQFGNSPGDPSVVRLFNAQLGGQIGWLLPLAFLGLVAATWEIACGTASAALHTRQRPSREPLPRDRRARSLLLWGGWLVSLCVLYSFANFFHPYNLVMLAPPISALAGIGAAALFSAWNRHAQSWWLLPATLAGTALAQVAIVLESPDWLRAILLAANLLAVGVAVYLIAIPARRPRTRAGAVPIAVLGMAALLVAPAAWASVPIWHYGNPEFPIAGPALLDPGLTSLQDTRASVAPATLTRYLLAHHHEERFILATRYGGVAAPVMLATNQAVLDYGGYLGSDQILSAEQVASLAARHTVRYFWVLSPRATTSGPPSIEAWVTARCTLVPARRWQPPSGYGPAGPRLYDCSPTAPAP